MRGIKILTLCLAVFGGAVSALSQVPASLLEGEVSGFKNCTVNLFRNIGGLQQKIAESTLTKSSNRFSFALPVSAAGEFVKLIIDDFDKEGVKEKNRKNYQLELFVKQDGKLDVRIELQHHVLQPSFPKCSLLGPSPENEIMLGWQRIYQQFRVSCHDDDPEARVKKFFTAYGQYKPKLNAYIESAVCKSNPDFAQVFREAARARLQFAPIDFYGTNAQVLDTTTQSASMQKIMMQAYGDLQAYCGDALFRMEGINNLSRYYHGLYREESMDGKATNMAATRRIPEDSVKALVCNKTIKSYFGAKASNALPPRADTSRWIAIPASHKNSRHAFVRVQLDGFTTTHDFTLTIFEKVTNRALVSVRPTDNYLLVPVLLTGSTMLSFDIFDLKARLYLRPGDSVDLRIYNAAAAGQKTRAQYTIRQGSAENRLLAAWYAYAHPVTRYLQPSTAKLTDAETASFPAEFNRIQGGLDAFMANQIPSTDPEFQKLFRQLPAFDMRLSALTFLAKTQSQLTYAGPHFKAFDANKVPEFFHSFSNGHILCAPDVFRFPDADQLVSFITKLQWALMPESERNKVPVGAKLGYQVAQLCSPEARSCLLYWDMRVTEPTNWREVRLNMLPNKSLFVTEEMKTIYDHVINTFSPDTQFIGKPIIDVPFADTTGRMIRLSDFKGKVVFIDVWATWCAPCRDQIPYLMKIEEEYHGNEDMVFIGLSVDRERDLGKWKKFIATEKLQGIQLIDYSGKIFQRKYQILGIPRFLLIDRKGNVSEVRCPYPSTGRELKAYLNELLETKEAG